MNIIELAKEAGFTDYYPERLTRFAALVRAEAFNDGVLEGRNIQAFKDHADMQQDAIDYEDWKFNPMTGKPIWEEEAEPVKQEPVAYMVKAHDSVQRFAVRADVADEFACKWRETDPDADFYPLYAAPVQPMKQEPVAFVSDIHLSRYTLEWNGSPLPEGTELYANPLQTVDNYYLEQMAEEAECVKLSLDKANVPTTDESGKVYSMWGRVCRYAAPVSCATSCPDAKAIRAERYFCQRCGKRIGDHNGVWDGIHTCTPPEDIRGLK